MLSMKPSQVPMCDQAASLSWTRQSTLQSQMNLSVTLQSCPKQGTSHTFLILHGWVNSPAGELNHQNTEMSRDAGQNRDANDRMLKSHNFTKNYLKLWAFNMTLILHKRRKNMEGVLKRHFKIIKPNMNIKCTLHRVGKWWCPDKDWDLYWWTALKHLTKRQQHYESIWPCIKE